jgi:hypothetical protein
MLLRLSCLMHRSLGRSRNSAAPPPGASKPARRRLGPLPASTISLVLLSIMTVWPRSAAAQQSDAGLLFDPTRLSVRQTFGYLTGASASTQTAAATQPRRHAYTSETELAYTATDWYQVAVAVPLSISQATGNPFDPTGRSTWNGVTLRQLFITPQSDQKAMFFGLSVQFSYTPAGAALPALASTNTPFAAGLTPIVGFRRDGFELIVSPTVAFGIGAGGVTALAPAARLTRKITENLDLGIEYGGALGSVGAISPPSQQAHIAYGVADIKLDAVDLDVGIGYGLTAASNGLALKLGIGHQY